MIRINKEKLFTCLQRFTEWLDRYGETSYDHQSFFAGPIGGRAKALYYSKPLLGTAAVAPIIFCEAFLPSARKFFWKPQRLPIADAHYAMGFSLLFQVTGKEEYFRRAVHFAQALEATRCPGYDNYCWGYPFDWVTRTGIIPAQTPLITTTPYAYEAFSSVFQISNEQRWLDVMHSIAEHAISDINDYPFSSTANTCSYTPHDKGGVVNASAYRASMLVKAYNQFGDRRYMEAAEKNINFVLETQLPNGAWPYSVDGERDFVDHFHTCFVMKALAKIDSDTGGGRFNKAIEKGIEYYLKELFDEQGFPKPFSKAPRLTVYKNELYDYAECLNLCILLRNRFDDLDSKAEAVLKDVLTRWVKPDGSFRSRRLLVGWDNIPMHRWAQSQMFRSLSLLLSIIDE